MPETKASYRPSFRAALRLLERAFTLARDRGASLPVIVGGSAVEFHTLGAIQSGDFDLVEGDEALIGQALLDVGFRKEDRSGHLLRGYFLDAEEYEIGVEFVSRPLFDGKTDRSRLIMVSVDRATDEVLIFPPIEDLIADRLAQYEAHPASHADMLEQARILYRLADTLDEPYLRRRMMDECASVGPLELLRDPDA